MATKKRAFRSPESYAFERIARDAVEPLLLSRGFSEISDRRKGVGSGQSQVVRAVSPAGEAMTMRVRLCWRRDGHSRNGHLYSAAQLAAHTVGGDWDATLRRIVDRDAKEGVTHTLLLQRDSVSDVYALVVPSNQVPALWHAQYQASEREIQKGTTGTSRKNHAANGDSPTIWLQDDRSEGGREVARVIWEWPGVLDIMSMPLLASHTRAKYWSVLDAVSALGAPSQVAEVVRWLELHRPGSDYSDTRENLALLTVNDANRRHYDRARIDFRSDLGHPRDRLYRSTVGRAVLYEMYEPARHGAFDLREGPDGTWTIQSFPAADGASALAQAESAQSAAIDAITSLEDAREFVMRSIAARRGQHEFRDALLGAYSRKCAITGCSAVEVLEAAHIVRHLGLHTQRTDNGLLLRADIHTLFDLGQIWIGQDLRIRIADSLLDTEYGELNGRLLALPIAVGDRPHPSHLEHHRRSFSRSD